MAHCMLQQQLQGALHTRALLPRPAAPESLVSRSVCAVLSVATVGEVCCQVLINHKFVGMVLSAFRCLSCIRSAYVELILALNA